MTEFRSIDFAALVVVDGHCFYVVATPGELIMDYPAYDPSFDTDDPEYVFRNGLHVVGPSDGHRFLESLGRSPHRIDELGPILSEYGPDRTRPIVLIDFDNATFTSSFFDQALEDEVGAGWTGSYADPMQHASPELQAIWPPFPE